MTPLLFAVRGGRIEATRTLLAAGADVNDRTPDGTSALMVAILNAHFELAVALLLSNGWVSQEPEGLRITDEGIAIARKSRAIPHRVRVF